MILSGDLPLHHVALKRHRTKNHTSLIEKSIDPEMISLVMGLDPYIEEIIDLNLLPYRVAVLREGLWGLSIGSFLNGEKKH